MTVGSASNASPAVDRHAANVEDSTTPLVSEYGRSFQERSRVPRPRNPIFGWHSRNASNILPFNQSAPPRPQRTTRQEQTWEWLQRQTARRIFPEENLPPQPITDVNNNPVVPRPQRRRTQWPWQIRAQTSHIFLDNRPASAPVTSLTSPRPSHRSQSAASRWPWQERAKRSVIHDLLAGNYSEETGKPPPSHRVYQWDQRQSNLVTAAVHCQVDPKSADEKPPTKWPWQERAQQSVVFRSPDKENLPRQIKYVWDQRRSRFTVKLDPEGKCQKGTHYKESYPKWQPVHNSGLKAAGKPCYTGDDIEDTNLASQRRGKRRSHNRSNEESPENKLISQRNINAIPLPSPSLARSFLDRRNHHIPPCPLSGTNKLQCPASNEESTCLDIVPLGYHFSEIDITKADRRIAKSI